MPAHKSLIHSKAALGILYMLTSAVFFSLMNAFVKLSSERISATELIFFRSFLMVLFLLPVIAAFALKNRHKARKGSGRPRKKGGYTLLFFRSFIGGISMLAIFYNISTIPLGISMAFSQATPIYVGVFSAIFLRERPGIYATIAIIAGFLGVLLISKPPFLAGELFEILPFENAVAGVLSGACSALAYVSVRGLRDYFDSNTIILSFGGVMSVVSLAIMAWDPPFFPARFVLPEGGEWLFIIAMGAFGTLGQYFMTRAYMFAPAGIVAPIDYTRILFSLLFGVLLGDALPDLLSTAGITLIIASGVLIAWPIFMRDLKRARFHAGVGRGT